MVDGSLAIGLYLLVGVAMLIWIIKTGSYSWGSLFLFPVFALLIVLGWFPLIIRTIVQEEFKTIQKRKRRKKAE
ncbi:hypothetical protein [Bacillus sp. NPDC094106]|uniref:hypothetical protein n=1 Tax=Bacillus sp. NPDC094106 TaxID=3363949 RepID=UPI00382EA4E5